jgi:peptidoglycan-associated lipoprotein
MIRRDVIDLLKNYKFQMKKLNHILLFLSILSVMIACNSPLQSLKNAQKHFDNGEYEFALKQLEKARQVQIDPAQVNWLTAESYRLSNRPLLATEYYEKALAAGSKEENLPYHLAFCYKIQGNYAKAQEYLGKFVKPGVKNRDYIAKAKNEAENLEKIESIAKRKTPYTLVPVGTNTAATEFGTAVINGGKDLVFTASKKAQTYKNNGLPFLGLYIAELKSATEIGNVQLFSSSINIENANEGSPAFSPDGRTMVFARGNTGKRKDASPDVDLYIARMLDGRWLAPELIVELSDSASWDGSPAFSANGKTLYFASNRRGGRGGTDLYSAKMDNSGRFSRPVNMGEEINTPGDDMFPVVSADGKLYFASDGHTGLGKLDIFEAVRKDGEITIKNMGQPINSSADDFGFMPLDSLKGYLTSNREGGKGDDDLYFYENSQPNKPVVEEPPVVVKNDPPTTEGKKVIRYFLMGKVIDTQGNPLDLAKVTLLDKESGTALNEITTTTDGQYGKFKLTENSNYVLLCERQGYFTKRQDFSMVGRAIPVEKLSKAETDTVFVVDILMQKPELSTTINKDVFSIAPIYYDLDQAVIRIDASVELDKIVQILNDNPTIKIELGSHTDSRAPADYNKKLSQRRANAAVTYIISKGISPRRITAKGYGESQLVNGCADNVPCSEDEHQLNRRTEFKVTEIK